MTDSNDLAHETGSAGAETRPAVRLPYHRPSLQCERLTLITRGGTIGNNDSGAQFTEQPPGASGSSTFKYGQEVQPYEDPPE